ncbi:MAG: bifunctional hydroxymethylpyrimidine kinase/phosphomethylpyrimidine kinase [Deltaproteobacteria bacterium]|nr:bifunctional hydroxymethylpyrimidine kinase/phosphomethylpyrimidine kinase [Deltaproteobacteria bacterium]
MRCILVIAGSDSCGGAGIQADIKTVFSLGAHAFTAVTALTAQNSLGITAIHRIPGKFLSRQIETILGDTFPHAAKIGMLFSSANVRELARILKAHSIPRTVLDPVMAASTGMALLEPGAFPMLKKLLLPLVTVVTPNIEEASRLSGRRVGSLREMEEAARVIKDMGPNVVITGGHLKGACVDLLYDGREMHRFYGERIASEHTHGSGCVFSTALATFLAAHEDLRIATEMAHEFTRRAISCGYASGKGAGAVRPIFSELRLAGSSRKG